MNELGELEYAAAVHVHLVEHIENVLLSELFLQRSEDLQVGGSWERCDG